MARLSTARGGITRVNLGGIHHRAGRTQRLRYVFLAPDEEAALRALAARGVDVRRRMCPRRGRCRSTECSTAKAIGDRRSSSCCRSRSSARVLGLDVVSFPQAMLSRPIVAATVGGALARRSGARHARAARRSSCFALETLPFGASRYPEWGSAAVVGGALFADARRHRRRRADDCGARRARDGWIGGWSMVQLRKLNARLRARSA